MAKNIRQLTEDDNKVFYPQTHENAVIDSNGVNMGTKIAGKQDTIQDLSTIRSGAAAGATAYQKPGTGIPKTDMASAVQTSLGKADTAYQKPGTGIPKTDMASAVQQSLDLADSAVQAENYGPILPPPETDEFATKTQVSQLEAELIEIQGGTETKNINLSDYSEYLFWIGTSTYTWVQNNGTTLLGKCILIPLDYVKKITVTATGGYATMAFLQTSDMVNGETPDFAGGTTTTFSVASGNTKEYDVPLDAHFLYIYATTQSGTDIKDRYDITFEVVQGTIVYQDDLSNLAKHILLKTIYPSFIYYSLSSVDGMQAPTYRGTGVYSSARFIAVKGRTIAVTLGEARICTIFEYDKDFVLLGRTSMSTVSANTRTEASLSYENTAYIKLWLVANYPSYDGDAKTTVKVDGEFPDNWDVFNPRPSDGGYMKVMVPVRVTDPTCCDEETSTVQDASQILPDYGVICLPEQYSNTGKPTRLIIYCHGAAVNYADNASRFNSVDLDPTYWLAEGYAVMDVEGNPFDNTNEHICIPQAMDCYVAAYKWAIEYFNLCRDGVFIGGRSMGGQNTFNLIRRECPIPVIAACPNSAAPDSMAYKGYPERRAFCALHMGFIEPEGFTWGAGPGLTDAEKEVILFNWDKFIKCCPQLSACSNLPAKEIMIDALYGEERLELWPTLHMFAKCPVKLFGCNQDQSCPPPATTSLFYRMLMNSGQIAECRLYNSYKDYTGTGTSAHHYDTQDPALRTTVTTSYGEELTNVPIVYIEMLAFWRRYEQGL